MFLEVSQNLQENTRARDSSLIKLACNFIKKESLVQAFSCEFCKISRTPFLQNTSGQLLQNGHAKILITHILYRRTTPEAYLEPSRRSTMEPFCKKSNFFKTFPSQMLEWVLNIPLSSEKLLQEWEYMTNSPYLMI